MTDLAHQTLAHLLVPLLAIGSVLVAGAIMALPLWLAFECGRRARRLRAARRAIERTRAQLAHIHERVAERRSTATEQALAELEADDTPFLEIGDGYDSDEIDPASLPAPGDNVRVPARVLPVRPSPELLLWAMRAVGNCGIPAQQSPALGIATLAIVASILSEAGFGIDHESWDQAAGACQRAAAYSSSPTLVSRN